VMADYQSKFQVGEDMALKTGVQQRGGGEHAASCRTKKGQKGDRFMRKNAGRRGRGW